MIEEVKRSTPPPKKKTSFFFRALAFLITLALALGAVALVVNRDKLNFDALKRWFTYRSLTQGDTGGGQPFPYQAGESLTLTACGGDLLSVSRTGVRFYSPGGTAYLEDTVTMDNPVCQVVGKTAVVYDAGGTFLKVYGTQGTELFELSNNSSVILSARLNESGYLAVVTRSSGYKGVVTVYNSGFQPLLELSLSSAFVLDALVAPDNRSVAVVTAGQQDQLFSCALSQYSLTEVDLETPVPFATWVLNNHLPLDLTWDGNGVRVLAEHAALCAGNDLKLTGEYSWSGRYLKRFSLLADDSFVVLTGKYRSGSQATLEVIDTQGNLTATLEETRPVLALSANRKYIGVLTARELNIYTRDLELYATVENTNNASQLVLLSDGSAYLATQDEAWLQLPNG